MDLPSPTLDYKWNLWICGLLWLASFTNHNVCKVLPCSLYQYFIPFLGQIILRYVFMHILSFHLSVDDHLFLFRLVQCCCEHSCFCVDTFSVLLRVYLEVKPSGSNGNFLTEEVPDCFPKQQYHFTFPAAVCKGSMSLLTFICPFWL